MKRFDTLKKFIYWIKYYFAARKTVVCKDYNEDSHRRAKKFKWRKNIRYAYFQALDRHEIYIKCYFTIATYKTKVNSCNQYELDIDKVYKEWKTIKKVPLYYRIKHKLITMWNEV